MHLRNVQVSWTRELWKVVKNFLLKQFLTLVLLWYNRKLGTMVSLTMIVVMIYYFIQWHQ